MRGTESRIYRQVIGPIVSGCLKYLHSHLKCSVYFTILKQIEILYNFINKYLHFRSF